MDGGIHLVDRVPVIPKLLVTASSQEMCEIPLPQNQQISPAAAAFVTAASSSAGQLATGGHTMADNIKPLESIWVVLPKPLSDEAKRDVLAGFRTLEELCDENNWYNEWLSRFSPHWAGVSCPMCGIHCHRSLHCPSPLKWREAERVKASGENLKALRDEFRAKRANKDKYADASSGTNV